MTDYPYEGQLIADPVTFQRATNAQVYVYDANDTTNSAPLALKDATGLPTANPLTSSADAFVKPIYAPSQDIKYVGAGLTVFVSSAKGMRDAAAASAAAAQTAADSASTAASNTLSTASVDGSGQLVVTKASGAQVNAGNVKGPKGDKGDTGAKGADGANVLPTDDAIKQAINDTASATRGALNATYAPASGSANYASPASVTAALDPVRKTAERPGGLLLGLPPVADRSASFGPNNLSNGTDTYHYSRSYHPVLTTANDIRLVYSNFAYGAAGPNNITVSAAVEAESAGIVAASAVTSLTPVMFNGQPSTVIAPGGFAVSDPIAVSITKGKAFYVRTSVNAAAGGKWPLGNITNPTAVEEEGLANGTAAVPGYMAPSSPTAVPKPGGRIYSPVAIIGSPATIAGVRTLPKSFLGVGDSIMDGVGGAVDNKGFFRVAARKAGYGFVDLGTPAQTAQGFLAPLWPKGPLHSSPYTAVICEYGSNDCAIASVTLGTVQISMIAAWRALAARGHKVIQTTITPRSTSTDTWKTTANQTPIPDYAVVRNGLNAWIRAGAPVTAAYAPAAIGAGTYVIGNIAHPLTAYFELADIVETARDSNIWKAPQGRSFTATSYQNSFSIDSTTAAYAAADIGETLFMPGAGPAGADVLLEVTGVPSGTRASVQGITSTAVASGTAMMGHMTPDGIHPSSTAHRMIGDALSTFLQTL